MSHFMACKVFIISIMAFSKSWTKNRASSLFLVLERAIEEIEVQRSYVTCLNAHNKCKKWTSIQAYLTSYTLVHSWLFSVDPFINTYWFIHDTLSIAKLKCKQITSHVLYLLIRQ